MIPIRFSLCGDADKIMAYVRKYAPGVDYVLRRVREQVPHVKREIRLHEAAILYLLAGQFNRNGAQIIELGTCHGWSAAVMAEAAPLARIRTCTPNSVHVKIARENLKTYHNVDVIETFSVELLGHCHAEIIDMVFVDGDHDHVVDDLPWFNLLRVGGLMLHHDYTPPTSATRPCRPVWNALNAFADVTGHEPDVLLIGPDDEGMAGWYRRAGEVYDGLRYS